jgi:hypothetical protein
MDNAVRLGCNQFQVIFSLFLFHHVLLSYYSPVPCYPLLQILAFEMISYGLLYAEDRVSTTQRTNIGNTKTTRDFYCDLRGLVV